jgi:hypothetical protein
MYFPGRCHRWKEGARTHQERLTLHIQPNATFGNVDDEAVAGKSFTAELDLCHTVVGAARRPASQRMHDLRLPKPSEYDQVSDDKL